MASIIVLMGPTGAGKSEQAKRLAATYGWAHLSTGSLLRQDPAIAGSLVSGQLVSSEVVEQVLDTAVKTIPVERSIILDGFPRTLDEVRWLEQHLPLWHRTLGRVVLIDVDEDTSERRLSLRGRSDDTPAARAAKWAEYDRATQPVIDYYARGDSLAVVDGQGTMDEVEILLKEKLA